jgi:hypothetical protein
MENRRRPILTPGLSGAAVELRVAASIAEKQDVFAVAFDH